MDWLFPRRSRAKGLGQRSILIYVANRYTVSRA